MTLGGFVAAWACSAAAQSAYAADSARIVPEAPDRAARIHRQADSRPGPSPVRQLPNIVDGTHAPCCCWASWSRAWRPSMRCACCSTGARLRSFDRLVGHSPLRAFGAALLLDVVAAGRAVRLPAASCWPGSAMRRASAACSASRSSRRCSTGAPSISLFRAWLRPSTPEGRIAPVDDAAARGLLVALNWIVVLPLLAGQVARALTNTGAAQDVVSAALILYVPLVAAGPAVGGLALAQRNGRLARRRWCRRTRSAGSSSSTRRGAGGYSASCFYGLMGVAAIYAALTETATASRGLQDHRILAAGPAAVRDADASRSPATSCRNCRWRATWWPIACA